VKTCYEAGPTGYVRYWQLTAKELDDALEAFSKLAPRQAKGVELRYFGGLSEEEAAEVLKISTRTVRRDWDFAKSWLMRELSR
jgi:RNA polymerase sigma factor (sigma-70 family)